MSLEYIAGLFDGEGTIGIYLNKGATDARYRSGKRGPCWTRSAGILACWRPTLESLHVSFGGTLRRTKADGHKQKWHWSLGAKADIAAFLNAVRPYLVEKKEQADVMLAALRGEIPEKEAAVKLKKLKRVQFE